MNPHPWRWIPTLYFGQGLPYVVVTAIAVVMFKNLGVSNAEIALLTSWLYLPWVIKPLWSPLVDLVGAKRRWIVALQFAIGAALGMVALVLPGPLFLRGTMAVLWLMAFASATHDIAADGFYMLALPQRTQTAFVGVRSTFYRLSMIAGQGGLVVLAGWLQERSAAAAAAATTASAATAAGTTAAAAEAWSTVFWLLAGVFVAAAFWHARVLPRPLEDRAAPAQGGPWRGYGEVFAAFFRKPEIARTLAFLLLYRFAEAQLLKLVVPFLLDPPAAGGLGLSTADVGVAYGTVGVAALTAGGLLGGWLVSRAGLSRMLWPLVVAMHAPNLVYVALAVTRPEGLAWVAAAVAVEQFGYGLGFTAYMVWLLIVAGQAPAGSGLAVNPHRTAHYAIGTGFMALGMMLPGLWAGWLQERIGYVAFFVWACVATLPSIAAAARLPVDPADDGRRPAA